jgi:hypothetical protein
MNSFETLISEVEAKAKELSDGHFSILKFTTHYKAFFGTMNLELGNALLALKKIPAFSTPTEALGQLVINKWNIADFEPTEKEIIEAYFTTNSNDES